MKNKLAEKMVSHIIKFKQDLPCSNVNFTELSLFILKTMKSNRLWKCINKCTNGRKLSKLLRNLITQKLNNWRATIIHGFWSQVKKKRLLKSKNKKVTMWLPSNCILRVVFQQELPTLFTTLMWAILKIYWKKLPAV